MTRHAFLLPLENAKTDLYLHQAVIFCSTGFFSSGYNLFSISAVTTLLGRLYYYNPESGKPGILPMDVHAIVVGAALCGVLTGQLFFGWAGDKWGRKNMCRISSTVTVMASLASGLSFGSTPTSLMVILGFFRFWVGFGIGGDYPLLATILSEYSNEKIRGTFAAFLFVWQGLGMVMAQLVSLSLSIILSLVYKLEPPFDHGSTVPDHEANFVWRVVLMFGAIPPAVMAFTSLCRKIPESPRYQYKATTDMEKVDITNEAAVFHGPVEKPYGLFSKTFLRRHGAELVGTTSTGFFMGFAFYSQSLLQQDFLTAAGLLLDANTIMRNLIETFMPSSELQLCILLFRLSGCCFSIAVIDRIGRKTIQIMGFLLVALFMFLLAFDFYDLRGQACIKDFTRVQQKSAGFDEFIFCFRSHWKFLLPYAFTFLFSSFGPNTTTLLVPAELFPSRLRSTCHGISSAAGTAGGIVGFLGIFYTTHVSSSSSDEGSPNIGGINRWLLVLAITNCLGLCFTVFIPETKGKSLEDLNGGSDNNSSCFSYTAESSSSAIEGYRNGDGPNHRLDWELTILGIVTCLSTSLIVFIPWP